jgi:hypothetical protein
MKGSDGLGDGRLFAQLVEAFPILRHRDAQHRLAAGNHSRLPPRARRVHGRPKIDRDREQAKTTQWDVFEFIEADRMRSWSRADRIEIDWASKSA